MSEDVIALLPVKRLTEAKRRLAAVLTGPQRAALVRCMLMDVTRVLLDSGLKPAVLSSDPAVLSIAMDLGASPVVEDSRVRSLNAAIRFAEAARRGPADRLLVLLPDTPSLSVEDVQQLLAAGRSAAHSGADAVLAVDHSRSGTNALLLTGGVRLAFGFGKGSLGRHIRAAEKAGLTVKVLDLPGVAFDVDTADDLAALTHLARRQLVGSMTQEFLQTLEFAVRDSTGNANSGMAGNRGRQQAPNAMMAE